jgi:hypothetical protein
MSRLRSLCGGCAITRVAERARLAMASLQQIML